MFEDREIRVLAYNLETILAEKYAAVLSLDVANTRMKDLYDIHMLVTKHRKMINPKTFAEAATNTARQRQILHLLSKALDIIKTIAQSPVTAKFWYQYQSEYSYASDISFADVTNSLQTLAEWQLLLRPSLTSQLNEYKEMAKNNTSLGTNHKASIDER